MKMRYCLTFCGIFCAAWMAVASSANYYWVTAGEGRWNDGQNWAYGTYNGPRGSVPGTEDVANIQNVNCTIELEGDITIGSLMFVWGTAANATTCTLKGTGTLTLNHTNSGGTTLQVNAYRTLVMDGPDIHPINGVQYCEAGTMIIKQGSYWPRNHYLKTAPGRLVIDGGTVEAGGWIAIQNGWGSAVDLEPLCFLDLKSGRLNAYVTLLSGTFTMTGGIWDRTTSIVDLATSCNRANMFIDIQGGEKIIYAECDTNPFPPKENFWNVRKMTSSRLRSPWYPIERDGTREFDELEVPKSTLYLSNNVALCGTRLDVANLVFHSPAHDIILDVDTLSLNTTGNFNPMASNASLTSDPDLLPLHVVSPRQLTLASRVASSPRFLVALNQPWTDAYWQFKKGVTFNTTAADGGVVNFYMGTPLFEPGATIDVTGCGSVTLAFSSYTNLVSRGRSYHDGLSNRLARISVTGGAGLTYENWAWVNRDNALRTDKFVLGSGSKLSTLAATYAHMEALEADLDPSSEICFGTPDTSTASAFPPSPVTLGPRHLNDFQTPASRPTVTLTTAGAADLWNCEWMNGMPVVWRKDITARSTYTMSRKKLSKWRGTDGVWANESNWLIDTDKEKAENPLEQCMVFDGGYDTSRVTVEGTAQAYQIRVWHPTCPLAFVGTGEFELAAHGSGNYAATAWEVDEAVATTSSNPLIFDVPVRLSDTVTSSRRFGVNNGGRSYVAFMKDVDGANVSAFKGDVLVGSAWTAQNLLFLEQNASYPARRTHLGVLPGGRVTVTCQTWLQSGSDVRIDVYSNAVFAVQNGSADCFWGVNVERWPINVRQGGRFDCACSLGGSAAVSFCGAGEVRLHDTGAKATADYAVTFGDNLTVAIDAFTAGHPVVFTGSPVWAAKADWTYSLAPVTLPAGETLTVDTADLDTGVGHAATIATAVTASKLVKRGAGSLTLGNATHAVEALEVQAGNLVLSAPLTLNALTFAEGASLKTVSGVLSPRAWTTLVTLPATAGAVTLPLPEYVRVRLVEEDGVVQYQARLQAGLTVNIR